MWYIDLKYKDKSIKKRFKSHNYKVTEDKNNNENKTKNLLENVIVQSLKKNILCTVSSNSWHLWPSVHL